MLVDDKCWKCLYFKHISPFLAQLFFIKIQVQYYRIHNKCPDSVFRVFSRQFSNFKVDFHDEKKLFEIWKLLIKNPKYGKGGGIIINQITFP